MMHESSVLCVNFSIDSELLASGKVEEERERKIPV